VRNEKTSYEIFGLHSSTRTRDHDVGRSNIVSGCHRRDVSTVADSPKRSLLQGFASTRCKKVLTRSYLLEYAPHSPHSGLFSVIVFLHGGLKVTPSREILFPVGGLPGRGIQKQAVNLLEMTRLFQVLIHPLHVICCDQRFVRRGDE